MSLNACFVVVAVVKLDLGALLMVLPDVTDDSLGLARGLPEPPLDHVELLPVILPGACGY